MENKIKIIIANRYTEDVYADEKNIKYFNMDSFYQKVLRDTNATTKLKDIVRAEMNIIRQ